ncbi:hypothetical protein LTR36_002944 [Oleoguttula mirabilis]|uniref:F-box domain-containing protein n=1 Tax=Oleoguttula mirabilis TaxID=1507867 RepID=A0AAV9JJM4_9PEZI|nr:hypothetical protein LTR36_002944 [Oleoguttula mirabilis]
MHEHALDCPFRHSDWGEYYCRCFLERYQADKIAAPPTDSYTASTQVFDVAELRELIQSFLSMTDLARLQRTNKAWRTSAQTSPRLRREFFLLPAGNAVAPRNADIYEKDLIRSGGNAEVPNIKRPLYPIYDDTFLLNPCLVGDAFVDGGIKVLGRSYSVVRVDLSSPNMQSRIADVLQSTDLASAADYEPWLEQYLTQPPVTALSFECCPKGAEDKGHNSIPGWIYNKDGVTMRDVSAVLKSIWSNQRDVLGVSDVPELLWGAFVYFAILDERFEIVASNLVTPSDVDWEDDLVSSGDENSAKGRVSTKSTPKGPGAPVVSHLDTTEEVQMIEDHEVPEEEVASLIREQEVCDWKESTILERLLARR